MLKRFLKDTSGNYAMLTALMMAPLMGAVALSVDIAEMSRQRAEVLATLDATNIATARYLLGGVSAKDDAEREAKIKAYARTYFDATLPSINPAKVELQTIVPKVNSDDGLKSIATLTYNPYFRPVSLALNGMNGDNEVLLNAEAEVSLETTLEVALVLDNSGSMDEKGKDKNGKESSKKRIDLLKDAAKGLVDRLAQRGSMMKQVDKPVQVSLVPFAGSVNVGPTNADASWMDTEGRSPIHHENFGWANPRTTIASNKFVDLVGGVYKKVGSAWGTEQNQTVTRFTMFKELKIATSGGGTKPYTTWQGCVESRPYPMNINDAVPASGDPASLFVPMFAVDEPGAVLGPNAAQPSTSNPTRYLNTWWTDDGSGSDAVLQSGMKKYFNIQSSNTAALAWNTYGAYTNYRGPNYSCTTTPITQLTDVTIPAQKAQLETAINAMQPLGATNVPEGMAWGWRTVSSAQPFTGGRPEIEEGNLKVVIVLTDGANTYYTAKSLGGLNSAGNTSYYSAYGYTGKSYQGGDTRIWKGTSGVTKVHETNPQNTNYTAAINSHFTQLCTNAKNAGIIVMTVALDLNDKNATEKKQIDILTSCSSESRFRKDDAGKPEKLFWNSNGEDLNKDFQQIADELSNLRITG